MYFPPARMEARDALDKVAQMAKREPQRGGPNTDDDVDPIQSWLSVVLGGGDPFEDSTTSSTRSTRSSTTSTRSRSSSTSTRSTSSSTSTRSTQEPIVTPTPTPQPSSATPVSRSTLTVTASVTNNASEANDSNSSKSGLPSVVVGVIVAAAVIFGLIFISLIARKIFQSRRRRRRVTWAGAVPFDPSSGMREKELPPPPPADTQEYTNTTTYPAYPPAAVTFAPYSPMAATTPYAAAAPPAVAPYPFSGPGATANVATNANAATMFNSSAYAPADLAGPVVITPPTPSTATTTGVVPTATVKRTFIPSLPDELSISTGDLVRVLSVYDDGWALCEKTTTGEQGVVPQECLDSIPSGAVNQNTPGQQLASGSTGSSERSDQLNRNSSLRRNQGQTY